MLPSTISSIRAIEGDEVLDYGGSVEAHRGAGASSARAQRWIERVTSGHDDWRWSKQKAALLFFGILSDESQRFCSSLSSLRSPSSFPG